MSLKEVGVNVKEPIHNDHWQLRKQWEMHNTIDVQKLKKKRDTSILLNIQVNTKQIEQDKFLTGESGNKFTNV